MADGNLITGGIGGVQAAKSPSRMENHRGYLNEVRDNLHGILTRIATLGDRLEGTRPATPTSEKSSPLEGILGEIEDSSTDILNTVQEIKESLARVEEML